MKSLALSTLVILAFQFRPAYSQFKVGLGGVVGFPTGNFAELNDYGVGAYIEGGYAFTNNLEVGLVASFISFGEIDISSGGLGEKTSIIPVLLAIDYKALDTNWTPYLGLGLGPYIIKAGSVEETKVGIEPNVGILLGSLNLGISYHLVSDFSFFSVQLGYHSR